MKDIHNPLLTLHDDMFWREHRLKALKPSICERCIVILLLVFVVCFSFDSAAAECVTPRGGYFNDAYNAELVYFTKHNADIAECTEAVILTGIEYAVLVEQSTSTSTEGLETLLITLFQFDAEVFAIVEISLILAFLTAHFGGRMVRWLGKT
jgi:hypothetical protein